MANPTLLLSAGASTYEPPTMTLSWTLDGLTIEKIVAAEDNLFLHKSPEFMACGLRWTLKCGLKWTYKSEPCVWLGLHLHEPNCVFTPWLFAMGVAGTPLIGSDVNLKKVTFDTRAEAQNLDKGTGLIKDQAWGFGMVSHQDLQAPGGMEKRIPDGKLTFELKLRARKHSEVPMPTAPPSDRLTQLGALLESGEDADVTFTTACGSTLRAHSFILALGSSTLKAMLRGPLAMPAPFNIRVPDDIAPDVLQLLLRFLYTDTELPATMPCHDALRLLHTADYYNVPRLATLCDLHMRRGFEIDNVLKTLMFAHEHFLTGLRAAALRFVAANSTQLMHAPQWAAMLLSHPELIMAALATVTHGEPPPVIVAPGRAGGAAGSVPSGGGQRAVEDGEPPGPKRPRVGDAS
jgi:hypothetical protein